MIHRVLPGDGGAKQSGAWVGRVPWLPSGGYGVVHPTTDLLRSEPKAGGEGGEGGVLG